VCVIARVRGAAHRRAVARRSGMAGRRLCGKLVAVELTDDPDHGTYREQKGQHEREAAKPHNPLSIPNAYSLMRRSLRAFPITETELNVMAALAIMGLSSTPAIGYRTPAAIGTPSAL